MNARRDEAAFRREYLGEFAVPDRFDLLAIEYLERTETYDRSVCSLMRDGVAYPVNADQTRLITRNAKDVIGEIISREAPSHDLVNFGISLRKAIHRQVPCFERRLRDGDWTPTERRVDPPTEYNPKGDSR